MFNLKSTTSQRDTFFEELLCNLEYNSIEKLIVVGHLVPNSESYFLSLNKKIPILIVPKQNSINKIVEHNLSKEIAILKFNRPDIQNHSKEFLNRIADFIGTSTFAMIDIGGVFISVIEQLYIIRKSNKGNS